MLVYKIDVLAELKKAGYNTNKLQKEKILASATIHNIKDGKMVGNIALDTICRLLKKQPGSIIKWIPDPEEES